MNRTRSLWMLSAVVGTSCVWWVGLRADEGSVTTPPSNRVVELLARIEKLERRVETLESRPQAVQQSTHTQAVVDEWLSPLPPSPSPSQPQFGIVYQLKRFTPEPSNANPPAPAGTAQKPPTAGGVEIRR